MKRKITLIVLLAFISFGINAQPTDWSGGPDIDLLNETTNVHGDLNSVKMVVNSGTQANCTFTSDNEIAVTAGETFSFSCYVQTSLHVRVRIIYDWVGASKGYGPYAGDGVEDADYVQFTDDGTVPTGATGLYIVLEAYDQTGFVAGEIQFIDDVTFESPTGTPLTVTNGDFELWPTGPVISNISANPWSPTSSETVTVSADIIDNVSVATASLSWGLSTGVYDQGPITMNVGTVPNYVAASDIPAQADGTTVFYVISATDGDANLTTSDEESYTVVDPVAHTISEIQTPTDILVSDASPYDGVKVTTTGIVYATASDGYYIQDGDGAWNGIFLYDDANTPAQGDAITVSGFVKEYYNLTELDVTSFANNSSGNTLYAATVVSTLDANNEDYEGVLIQVRGATCTNADAGYGEWVVDDNSGEVTIDDVMFAFTPNLNVKYNVTGPATFSYSAVKILPRDAADIQDATSINALESGISIFPNPSKGVFNINVENNYNLEVFDITGRVLNSRTLTGNTSIELNTAGIYFLKFSDKNGSYTQKVIVQ